jgi:hypothetical protein
MSTRLKKKKPRMKHTLIKEKSQSTALVIRSYYANISK